MEFPALRLENSAPRVPTGVLRAAKGPPIAPKILILAGDTDGNIGDLAIVTATCERLQTIYPGVEISLLTGCPVRDVPRLKIKPLKRGLGGLLGLIRATREADLVICGCGGLFQDDDSLLKMPYWALRLLFLRPFAKRMVGLSIGAGPLDHPVSRFFGRLALKTLDAVSVRDAMALAVLRPLTRKPITIVPDPAFMLRPANAQLARQALREAGVPEDKPLVGVAVRRWFHTKSNLVPHKYATKLGLYRNRGRKEMAAFVESTAKVLRDVATESGAHIVFLPTYNVDHENDAAVCEAVGERLAPGSFSVLKLDDPHLYKAVTGRLTVMLCGRMHPAILAAGVGTPIVGMAYNQKFFGMFEMLRQGEHCLCLNRFTELAETQRLSGLLRGAVDQPEAIRPDTLPLERQTRVFLEALLPRDAVVRAHIAQPEPERQ